MLGPQKVETGAPMKTFRCTPAGVATGGVGGAAGLLGLEARVS